MADQTPASRQFEQAVRILAVDAIRKRLSGSISMAIAHEFVRVETPALGHPGAQVRVVTNSGGNFCAVREALVCAGYRVEDGLSHRMPMGAVLWVQPIAGNAPVMPCCDPLYNPPRSLDYDEDETVDNAESDVQDDIHSMLDEGTS